MYLTKLVIEPQKPMDTYAIHKELWKLFPGDPDAKRDFLFRVDYGRRNASLKILLQSHAFPSAPAGCMARIAGEPKKFSVRVTPGQYLRFAICANPTVKLKKVEYQPLEGHKTIPVNMKRNKVTTRVQLFDEGDQAIWLERKLLGVAKLMEVFVVSQKKLYFKKKENGKTLHCKIATVTFSGTLKVTDTSKLANLVEKGIGPAKAFGCGLLSLARV